MSTPVKEQKIFGMALGASPKQLAALGVLLVILGVAWIMTHDSGDAPPQAASSSSAKAPPNLKALGDPGAAAPTGQVRGTSSRAETPGGPRRQGSRQALSAAVKEFRPSLKGDKDNPIDPSKTDPTIRFDALAKVQSAGMAGGGRSLFDFGSAAPDGPKPGTLIVKVENKYPKYGPEALPPLPKPPPDPPPPAIPLKFYGFVNARSNDKRAFFMENDEIYIAREGETIKNRYKLIRIGVNSAVIEDTQFKNQQTIKLTEEATSTN